MHSIFFVTVLALLVGCQGEPPAASPARTVVVRLKFPQALQAPAARWERFVARAIQLEIIARTGAGQERRLSAGPLGWANLTMSDLGPPRDEKDTLEVEARLWDRNREGIPRQYPVATGTKKVSAGEWGVGAEVPVRMSLQVSVKDYD